MSTNWLWPLDARPLFPDNMGMFGTKRSHDVHTGIDLFCERGTNVIAAKSGIVVNIVWFTGKDFLMPDGQPSDWWNPTKAIMIETQDIIIVYGEIDPNKIYVSVGDQVNAGQVLGVVDIPVLKSNKGRPMVMLHVECMTKGSRQALWWMLDEDQPSNLINPYPYLLDDAAAIATDSQNVQYFDLCEYDGKQFIDPNAPIKPSKWWQVWQK